MIIITLLLSCQGNSSVEPTPIKELLIGLWDMQIMRNDQFLWHYEQGFQLMKNNQYHPRYWNRDDSTYYTDDSITGRWELGNDPARIFFYNDSVDDTVVFELDLIEEEKIKLSGKSVSNNMREIVLFKVH